MKVALVGATGLVGEVMLKVLAERNFPLTELIPVASNKSIGRAITFNNKIVSNQFAAGLPEGKKVPKAVLRKKAGWEK